LDQPRSEEVSDKQVVSVQGAMREALPQVSVQSYTFEQVRQMGISFAKSGLFGVKDPDQAFSLLMYGQALGKHPAVIMMDYDLINNRLAKKASAMLRDFQRSGGRVDWKKYDDNGCIGIFTHPMSPTPVTVDWTMERAKKAGLAAKNGDMYGKYTRAMFRSRCISEGVRTTAPDATENLYTVEELRAIEDDAPIEAQTENNAVSAAVEQVQNETPLDAVEALIMSLDVKTMPELTAAFEAAWLATKGDAKSRARIKSVYESQKAALESGDIT
jgi:hypothetical protein